MAWREGCRGHHRIAWCLPSVGFGPLLALRVGLGLLIKSKNLIKHGVKVEYFIPQLGVSDLVVMLRMGMLCTELYGYNVHKNAWTLRPFYRWEGRRPRRVRGGAEQRCWVLGPHLRAVTGLGHAVIIPFTTRPCGTVPRGRAMPARPLHLCSWPAPSRGDGISLAASLRFY